MTRTGLIALNVAIFLLLVILAAPSLSPLLTDHPEAFESYGLSPMAQPHIDQTAATAAVKAYSDEKGLREFLRLLPVAHLVLVGVLVALKMRGRNRASEAP